MVKILCAVEHSKYKKYLCIESFKCFKISYIEFNIGRLQSPRGFLQNEKLKNAILSFQALNDGEKQNNLIGKTKRIFFPKYFNKNISACL